MHVQISNKQKDLPIKARSIEPIVKAILTFEECDADEVSVNLVDTKTICTLHADYFNDPSTTDCISFPIDDDDEDYCLLGEIFVCPQTAIDYVDKHGGDPYEETTLYIIHGLLHLMGYDDIEEQDRQLMREREAANLAHLKKLKLQVK